MEKKKNKCDFCSHKVRGDCELKEDARSCAQAEILLFRYLCSQTARKKMGR